MAKNGRYTKRDRSLKFLLEMDPDFEGWRGLAVEWLTTQQYANVYLGYLTDFFSEFLHKYKLDKNPIALFDANIKLPSIWDALKLGQLTQKSAKKKHDVISDFMEWVLQSKLIETSDKKDSGTKEVLKNPFPRLQKKNIGIDGKKIFDPNFMFLLKLDPAFEGWQILASRWYEEDGKKKSKSAIGVIGGFLIDYIHGHNLDKRPELFFNTNVELPDLWHAINLDQLLESSAKNKHDTISDFLDWVLKSKLLKNAINENLTTLEKFKNPFPRLQLKKSGKTSDIAFSYVVRIDENMSHWVNLAAEWLGGQIRGVPSSRAAIDKFLVQYIIGQNLSKNPIEFLSRRTPKPIFLDVLVKNKKKGETGTHSKPDIVHNNCIADFIDWVLLDKLSSEDDHGYPTISNELHNPIVRMSKTGLNVLTESTKSSLSIRFIKELRTMLAEGPNFSDWAWAQQAMEGGTAGGDWFMVNPKLIDANDPDCVWRERKSTKYEQKILQFPPLVTELWSPVRAVAIYLKLELPLRTFQVRMLDSGEADTWRYIHNSQGGNFLLNGSPLSRGTVKRPYQQGVFYRNANETGAGLFINTNKTADINRPENAKGYVIPWSYDPVLYWLSKLRQWQERYNPLDAPMDWGSLEHKHFGYTKPHPQVLASRGSACFLFRDAAANGVDKYKPIPEQPLVKLWYKLLYKLEQRCATRGERLDDETPIQFVGSDSAHKTHFPLHALRVSLISYLVLDLRLPIQVVSKLIAGHANIIMTLYYTKFGHAYMKEVLNEAERNILGAEEASHRRYLIDAAMDQASERFASISPDGFLAASNQKSAAAFVFEDKGICPVGGSMCNVGGEKANNRATDQLYLPVIGYPHERNCVRCRFFLSGPAFLPGLQAHFNSISYEAHERSVRYNELSGEVISLENLRANCENSGQLFTKSKELERLSHRYEAEAESLGKIVNDLQATHHLIARSLEIINIKDNEGVQLVGVGEMADIKIGFIETSSALHHLEVICENAVIYPEIDARKPVLQRSQLLDCMLELNKMPPIFFRLTHEQQLQAGNAVMKLIQARAGSLKGALEYAEGRRKLEELGLADEAWNVIAMNAVGIPVSQIADTAQVNYMLNRPHGDHDASR